MQKHSHLSSIAPQPSMITSVPGAKSSQKHTEGGHCTKLALATLRSPTKPVESYRPVDSLMHSTGIVRHQIQIEPASLVSTSTHPDTGTGAFSLAYLLAALGLCEEVGFPPPVRIRDAAWSLPANIPAAALPPQSQLCSCRIPGNARTSSKFQHVPWQS